MIPALEAVELGKRYGRTRALDRCSVAVPAGRVAALVGPNGAGKSTLLHLSVGLLAPTAGVVRALGWSPRAEPELVLARVGFVAQDTPLYHRFTVRDTLDLGRHLNRRWDQRGAEVRLARLDIPLDRGVGQLSGGQRAQVALALALGKRPELLLLDEPLASLDPLARRGFLQELMDAVAADGVTVVLSSHLLTDLERVCDHLVILKGGRVQLAGGIEDVVGEHRMLVGPAQDAGFVPVGVDVVRRSRSERQATLWVRGAPGALPPGWRQSPLSLEELVLTYLAVPTSAPAGADLEAAS